MKSKVNAKTVLLIIVCLAAFLLLKNLVFSEKHPIVVQHYNAEKTEYVFYKNVTKEKISEIYIELFKMLIGKAMNRKKTITYYVNSILKTEMIKQYYISL